MKLPRRRFRTGAAAAGLARSARASGVAEPDIFQLIRFDLPYHQKQHGFP